MSRALTDQLVTESQVMASTPHSQSQIELIVQLLSTCDSVTWCVAFLNCISLHTIIFLKINSMLDNALLFKSYQPRGWGDSPYILHTMAVPLGKVILGKFCLTKSSNVRRGWALLKGGSWKHEMSNPYTQTEKQAPPLPGLSTTCTQYLNIGNMYLFFNMWYVRRIYIHVLY